MARVKHWTEDDARFARDWLKRTDIKVDPTLDAEPDVLAQYLKDTLTVSDWNRMLGAIRQRKHQAASDSVRITKSELERLQADLDVRDAEIDQLKAEVSRAQEQVAAARARESGYREQISRLESRLGQVERSAHRQTDEKAPALEELPERDRQRQLDESHRLAREAVDVAKAGRSKRLELEEKIQRQAGDLFG